MTQYIHENGKLLSTLESGIDVAPWINVASGKFDKKKNVQTYVVNFKSFKSVIRP